MNKILVFTLFISGCAIVYTVPDQKNAPAPPVSRPDAYGYADEYPDPAEGAAVGAQAPAEYATVRPDQQPQQDYPTPANWEFYSQKGGTPLRRANADSVGKMFRPDIAALDTTDLNRFVVHSDSVFYKNFYGDSLLLGAGSVNIYNSNGVIYVPGSARVVRVDSLTDLQINYTSGSNAIDVYGGLDGSGTNGNVSVQNPSGSAGVYVSDNSIDVLIGGASTTASVSINDGVYNQLMLLQAPSFYVGNFNSDDDTELRISYEPGLKSVQGSVQNNTFYAREDSAGFDVALSGDMLTFRPADSLIFLGRNNGQYSDGVYVQTGVDGNINLETNDQSRITLSEGVYNIIPQTGPFQVRTLASDIYLNLETASGYDLNGIPNTYPGVAYRDKYQNLGQYAVDMLSFISVDTIGSAYVQATVAPGQKDIGIYLGTYDPIYAGQFSLDTINGAQILSPTAIFGHWGLAQDAFGESGLNIYGQFNSKEAHISQTLGSLSIGGSENSFAHTYTYTGDPAGIILAQTFADTVGTAYLNLDTHGGGAGKFAKIGVQGQLGASSESWVRMDTVGVEIRTGGTVGSPNDVITNDAGRATWSNSIGLVSGSFSGDLYGQTVKADQIIFAGNYSGTVFTVEPTAGTGATAAGVAAQSSDGAGRFSVTTGTGASDGLWLTVTFDGAFPVTPIVQIYNENSEAATVVHYVAVSTTGFEFFVENPPSGVTIADLTTYAFNYITICGNQ